MTRKNNRDKGYGVRYSNDEIVNINDLKLSKERIEILDLTEQYLKKRRELESNIIDE